MLAAVTAADLAASKALEHNVAVVSAYRGGVGISAR